MASVFRTVHTIKGSCGFLGFARLEKLTHAGESLLSRLRDGQLTITSEITSGLLAMVDAVRHMLTAIQASGQDGPDDYAALIQHLAGLQTAQPTASTESAPAAQRPVAPPKDADASTPPMGVTELAELADPAKIGGLLVARGQVAPEDLAEALRVQEPNLSSWILHRRQSHECIRTWRRHGCG